MVKKRKYFKNVETGDIYKESGDKFGYQYLKMTPWEEGEDRRTNINELKRLELEGKVVEIPYHDERRSDYRQPRNVQAFLKEAKETSPLSFRQETWQQFEEKSQEKPIPSL